MEQLTITIDGHKLTAPAGQTILNVALAADIFIPHLCHHPNLKDIGACRLCVVQIQGCDEVKTACTTEIEDGMVIDTKAEKLNAMRRLSMELMLANHVDDCTTCLKYLKCELQSLIQYLGVSTSRLKRTLNSVPENRDNPLIIRDMDRCVSCGRCVRVCRDLRGVHVLDYQYMEDDRIMVDIRNHRLLSDENCRFCGACIEVCPTGALRDADGVIIPSLNRELSLTPCKAQCPANIDVPRYVRFIKEGRYQDAIAVIREKAPFPQSLGHICMGFCESACRRKEINDALSIRELKKFAAAKDEKRWKAKSTVKPATGKTVAVVGAGPAGLTAAYYLAKQGHKVTVFEKMPVAGGMLALGIPEYRLPRAIVAAEIAEIAAVGVTIKTDTAVNGPDDLAGFDKVLFAIGATKGARLPIPGADLPMAYENIGFLQRAALHDPLPVGQKVVVLGGGNVAFDCARTAKRLGAAEVVLTCLEPRDGMTASDEEIAEGEAEGIQIVNSRTFLAVESVDETVSGVKCQEVASFSFDENKRLQLQITPDSEHIIPADTVIFATGQRPEIAEAWQAYAGRGNLFATEDDGLHVKDSAYYAAGDCAYGTDSVIKAINSGRKAAIAIDIDLGGDGKIEEPLATQTVPDGYLSKDETFLAKTRVPVHGCFTDDAACREAARCLQCDLRLQLERPKVWANYKIK